MDRLQVAIGKAVIVAGNAAVVVFVVDDDHLGFLCYLLHHLEGPL